MGAGRGYPNGANHDDLQPGFSVTKSFMSTLVGIAIHDGRIRSVDDAVIGYLPELRGRGLDDLRIRDRLTMSSGVGFDQVGAVFPPPTQFSDDPCVYYSPDLRSIALSVRSGPEPVGQAFRYNDHYLLLEGITGGGFAGRGTPTTPWLAGTSARSSTCRPPRTQSWSGSGEDPTPTPCGRSRSARSSPTPIRLRKWDPSARDGSERSHAVPALGAASRSLG
jgi:hypothetical protein